MVGNLGSENHLDYTVIGKTVNLAARLCGLARQSIVVSRAVRDAVAGDAGIRVQLGAARDRCAASAIP